MPPLYSVPTWYAWQSTSTATTIDIWPQWATTTSTATTGVYQIWVDSQYHSYQQASIQAQQQAAHAAAMGRGITPEDLAQIQADANRERLRHEARQREQRKALELAEEKARVLLEANLALEERLRLAKEGHIFVRGHTGARYRIRKGRVGNVDVIGRDGRVRARLCAHPGIWTPDYDVMLAQKLQLETDDATFVRIANNHGSAGNEQVMEAE